MGDDDFADRTVTDLKVLAMVQKGCKLAVRKGQLAIDEPGYARFLWRWMRHDCRDLTLLHVRSSVNGALALLARAVARAPLGVGARHDATRDPVSAIGQRLRGMVG